MTICINEMVEPMGEEFVTVCEAHQMTITKVTPQERINLPRDKLPAKIEQEFSLSVFQLAVQC